MTVSDQIIQVLNALCEKFGLAIDWTSENVLPYVTMLCTKLVTYEIWTSVVWIVILAIPVLTITILIARNKETTRELLFDEDEFGPLPFVLIAFLVLGLIAGILCNVFDIIKCITFPEMFVFEYIQGVINAG